MILSAFALHAHRATLVLAALGSVSLPASHAAAKNHDIQTVQIPSVAVARHDRAPGPVGREMR